LTSTVSLTAACSNIWISRRLAPTATFNRHARVKLVDQPEVERRPLVRHVQDERQRAGHVRHASVSVEWLRDLNRICAAVPVDDLGVGDGGGR